METTRRTCNWSLRILAAAIPLLASLSSAASEVISDLHPFLYDTKTPDRFYLVGPIEDARAPVRLNQALARYPKVDTVVLASQGGSVYLALPMAYTIRTAGLRTHIPAEASCESACAYMFFAGVTRSADGPLGVHQLAVANNSMTTGQIALSDIVTAYTAFGVPNEVLSRMLATPPDKMYLFMPEELAALGLVGGAGQETATAHSANGFKNSPWVPTFFPRLNDGEVPVSLFEGCAKDGDNVSCNVLWGLLSDGSQENLKAWWVGTNQNDARMAQGSRMALEEDIDFIPTGVVRNGHTTIFFDPKNAKMAMQDQPYIAISPFKFETASLLDAGSYTSDQFGIFAISSSPDPDLYVVGTMGSATFWRQSRSLSSDATELCSISADGSVPWDDFQFSEDGHIMAAAHGNWTMVSLVPPSEQIKGEAGEWNQCTNIQTSRVNYFPFLSLSKTGKYTAVMDRQNPNPDGTPYQFEEYVLGVYDSAWLVHAENQGVYGSSASERAAAGIAGLYANMYGHESPIAYAEFSRDESHVLSLTEEGVLRIWSLPKGRKAGEFAGLDGAAIDAAEFVGDTGCLLVSAKGHNAVFLDPFTGEVVQEFPAPSARFMLDAANDLLFTYSFGERPIRAYESTGYSCRP